MHVEGGVRHEVGWQGGGHRVGCGHRVERGHRPQGDHEGRPYKREGIRCCSICSGWILRECFQGSHRLREFLRRKALLALH